MKRILATLFGLAGAAATTIGLTPAPAQAAPAQCPSGSFCIYRDVQYRGGVYAASGDDNWWYNDLFSNRSKVVADNDSSWFNNGITGPGIPSYVRVYEDAYQNGAMTICLRAGTGFPSKPASSDRGGSHGWHFSC